MTKRPAPKPRRAPAPRAPAAGGAIDSIPLAAGRKPHPVLGLGLWGLGRWTSEDEARTKATIGRAYERGMRWFDTAEVYGGGRSERILGEVLHRAAGGADDAFVVTKVSWEHLRPAQVRASLINSLERLARRTVDLYLVHAPDPRVSLEETMPALEALWKEGKVGAIGVSNFSVDDLETAAKHLHETRIAVNQVRYNLLDRDDGDPVREYCQTHGILLEAYTPLARGLLNGRYLDGQRIPAGVRRLSERLLEPEREKETLAKARALRDLAQESHLPVASLALHWLRRQGAVPVFGASRPGQVDENLAAWVARPDDAVLDRAEAIARGERA
ncbi:MAG TPA: aldo/keto reductase [Thermoplasmata archaeon]|nr:aldo/keto reductase [Thermoplasmata archaeon]